MPLIENTDGVVILFCFFLFDVSVSCPCFVWWLVSLSKQICLFEFSNLIRIEDNDALLVIPVIREEISVKHVCFWTF